MILVAPTEPNSIKTLGKISSLPEKHGCDILFCTNSQWHGLQRKELNDLLVSLGDGRLTLEINQMITSPLLSTSALLIEGTPTWTNEGTLKKEYGSPYTIHQHNGLLLSLANKGISTVFSPGLHLTSAIISSWATYQSKEQHRSLLARPKTPAKNRWGVASNREYQIYLLQSIPAVGIDAATLIVDAFGGLPLKWTCSKDELLAIHGIGQKTVARMAEAVQGLAESVAPVLVP
jgi:ERCC4-type nuclease